MAMRLDRTYLIPASDILTHRIIPKWDFHIHTTHTDGKASVSQVFSRAIEQNLDIIVFTEHAEPWRSHHEDWYMHYVEEIEHLRLQYQDRVKAFIGIEAAAITMDGCIEWTLEMKERSEFVLGAAHRYPGLGGRKVKDLSRLEAIDLEYRTLMGLASNTEIDAVAHIGATCTKYCTPFPEHLAREVIREATRNGIAIEINPVYHRPLIRFLEICADENARITLGSNAHGFGDIGRIVRELETGLPS